MLQRIMRAQSATMTYTFYEDASPTNPTPDSATVTITRDDGTVIAADAVTADEGTGVASYTLTPAETAVLDVLRFDWEATFSGQVQTFSEYAEVVGGHFFTVAQARATDPLNNTVKYPTQAVIDARTFVETELENTCGVAFVPRYGRKILSGEGGPTVMLPPRVTAVRSVKVDGVAMAGPDLATIRVLPTGEAYLPSRWIKGFANYDIVYEHGLPNGPEIVGASQVALTWVKNHLVKGPIDDRTTAFSTEDGTFSMSTPGVRGAVTGLPYVDSFIQRHDLTTGVA